MTTIRPVGHKILIAPLEWKVETDWGFQVTSHADSESAKVEKAGRMIGVLTAKGPQAWKAFAAMLKDEDGNVLADWAEEGDTVMYSRFSGKEIYDPDTGQEFYLINDEDVLAVLPPQDEWKYKPTEKGEKT